MSVDVDRDALIARLQAMSWAENTNGYITISPGAFADVRAAIAALKDLTRQIENERLDADTANRLLLATADRMISLELAEARLTRERDQAIAHDRQPYPTAWAYEQMCRVEREQRARAESAEAERDELRAALDTGDVDG